MRRERLGHRRPAPDLFVTDHRDDDGADQEQNRLHALGPNHRQQAAQHRVNTGEQTEHHDEKQQRVHAEKGGPRRQVQDAAQHVGCRVKRDAHVNDNGRKQRGDAKNVPARPIETALEKIGQRGDLGSQVKWRKEKREQYQREPRHPLEIAEDQPVLVGRLGQADQVHGGNVRRKHREPDHGPFQGVARQEIVSAFATPLALATHKSGHHAQAHDGGEIKDDDPPVERT